MQQAGQPRPSSEEPEDGSFVEACPSERLSDDSGFLSAQDASEDDLVSEEPFETELVTPSNPSEHSASPEASQPREVFPEEPEFLEHADLRDLDVSTSQQQPDDQGHSGSADQCRSDDERAVSEFGATPAAAEPSDDPEVIKVWCMLARMPH
jgi:hypothetical protein